MKKLFVWIIAGLLTLNFQVEAQSIAQKVSVADQQFEVKSSGIEKRALLQPLVIFEAAAGESMVAFEALFDQVAEFAPVIAYNRLGLGEPSLNLTPITAADRAGQLDALLAQLQLPPPYIIVGHQYGGLIANEFLKNNPDEVVGLIYLDPISPSENLGLAASQLAAKGWDKDRIASVISEVDRMSYFPNNATANQELAEVKQRLVDGNINWDPSPGTKIPSILMLSRKNRILSPFPEELADFRVLQELLTENRIAYFQDWTSDQPDFSLILAQTSPDFLPRQAATPIGLYVQQLIYAKPAQQLIRAAHQLSPEDFATYLLGLPTYLPSFLVSERTLNGLGYSLMREDLNAHALLVMAHNLKNHPSSANAYDSYGDALLVVGRADEAAEAFEKAVELGTQSNHRDLGLFIKNLKRSEEILNK